MRIGLAKATLHSERFFNGGNIVRIKDYQDEAYFFSDGFLFAEHPGIFFLGREGPEKKGMARAIW